MFSYILNIVLFFYCTATTDSYTYGHTLSLHDALPIYLETGFAAVHNLMHPDIDHRLLVRQVGAIGRGFPVMQFKHQGRGVIADPAAPPDRKSTRLNSSH